MNKKLQTLLTGCAIAVAASATTVTLMRNDSINRYFEDTEVSGQNDSSGSGVWKVANHPGVENDFTKAAESSINGVVSIKSYATPRSAQQQGQGFSDPFFEFFFGNPYRQQPQQQPKKQEQQPLGLGSGVIISADGYIVTNNHVIDGAERLEITLNDNRTFNATVIGTDPLDRPCAHQDRCIGAACNTLRRQRRAESRRMGTRRRQSFRVHIHCHRRHCQRQGAFHIGTTQSRRWA